MMRPVFGALSNLHIIDLPVSKAIVTPNPVTDILRITNYELRITSVEIFDILGNKHVSHIPHCLPQAELDVAHLTKGLYFVRIYYENNTIETVKLIKK